MKKKILIVEDEILIGMMLAENIRDFGYDPCEVVTSANEALQAVREQHPDAILMDISLSGRLDGIDAAQLIREYSNVPIIFFTGYRDQKLLKRAQATNPVAILDKLGPTEAVRDTLGSIFAVD